MKIISKEIAFVVLITMHDNAFSWKRKGLKGPQVIILSITNNTLATVRLTGTVFLCDLWDFYVDFLVVKWETRDYRMQSAM